MDNILEVRDLYKSYTVSAGFIGKRQLDVLKAIDLHIGAGEVVGLVGESGSGKTTLARSIMGMIRPEQGSVLFDEQDMTTLSRTALRARRRDMAMVYQNPYMSLNPRLRVADLLAEPITAHERLARAALSDRVAGLLAKVGLDAGFLARRVGELSGGQAQRVAIARALALEPKLILLDEPTSALDVSVQAQVLNLLGQLQREAGYSYLLISHNLDVIRYACDRVYVMQQGELVESGPVLDVLDRPRHPYTQALIAATPVI